MSQANDAEAISGNSSRSSSPASEDIDMEGAPVSSRAPSSQQQYTNAPLSPISPQKNGDAQHAGGRLPASKQAGGRAPAQGGNKKRPGHNKHDSSGHMRDRDGSGYSRAATGLMDPAQGSAYERLLDLNYPRDYGDPVLRYDAAMARSASASSAQGQMDPVSSSSS